MEAMSAELVRVFTIDGGKINDDLGKSKEKRFNVGLSELDMEDPIVDLIVGCCG